MSADRDAFRAPKGTHDVLPPESERWTALQHAFAERAGRFGYGRLLTPVFEHRDVFLRVGESTDVVRKEMYDFADKGGRALSLRPEGTAPVVRAYVQHRPVTPWKVWYSAPNFRYERAQKGRYRQHWQLGAEVLGVDDPAVDVEVMDLLHGFFVDLGLTRFRVLVNSMGDRAGRTAYVEVLGRYLRGHERALGPEFAERVAQNPLRVLDSKVPEWQDVIERAPQLFDHLTDAARARFEAVQTGLDRAGIAFEIAPRLVRGFDYYTATVFEVVSDALDAAQNAIGGGGRYDGLAEEMDGPPTPGIGFGLGVERTLIACDAEGVLAEADPAVDVFVVERGATLDSVALLHELRAQGLSADKAYGGRPEKAQWKMAAGRRARFTVVLDASAGASVPVVVRERRTGVEHTRPRVGLTAWLVERVAEERVGEARVDADSEPARVPGAAERASASRPRRAP